MDTVTRTFPISISNTYTANSIIEFCHFRDMAFDDDERVAIYLESFFCNLNLKSFNLGVIPDFDGDESEAEKMAKFNASETKSQKVGLRILIRKNNTGTWEEKAEIILVNRGRKDYFDLLQPYLAKNQVAILERSDALAIQLIDYGNGLLKSLDTLRIEAATTITISKKNDIEALQTRISALEALLGIFGAATSTAAGTNGLVKGAEAGQQGWLLRGDREWQNPATLPYVASANTGLYGSAEIAEASKNGWSGIFFKGGGDKNYLMQNPSTGDIGLYNSVAPRWNFYVTDANAAIGLPLQINSSAILRKILFLSTIISLSNIPAGGLEVVTVSFTGVLPGHFIIATPAINPITNGFWTFYIHCQVLAINQVTLSFKNDWSAALDLPDFWVRLMYVES